MDKIIIKPIRIVKTIYPLNPYSTFNEWRQFIQNSVTESKSKND
jgi:hypothetical protein